MKYKTLMYFTQMPHCQESFCSYKHHIYTLGKKRYVNVDFLAWYIQNNAKI